MAMIRVSDGTKAKMQQAGDTLLKLARAGAPGVEVANHSGASWVPADHIISRAVDALLVDLEADLEIYHVNPKPKGKQAKPCKEEAPRN